MRTNTKLWRLPLGLLSGLASCALADSGSLPLQHKAAPLSTPWTALVSRTAPLPEYPRPQLVRPDWLSLNGPWQYQSGKAGEAPPVGRLKETILVPFPSESALSGIQRNDGAMWYRRSFTVPRAWNGRRVLLHFGAVDFETTVYLNGRKLGSHRGGYDSFSFDLTAGLRPGVNVLTVGVSDPTDIGSQPIGKQRLSPDGIFYTATSGIWQTVWLEPVAAAHIERLDLTPDLPGGALQVVVQGTAGQTVRLTARANGRVVGTASGTVGQPVRLPVPNAHLWSPDDPFLYTLTAELGRDRVQSYFGMRSIGLGMVNGQLRPLLNGKFVFQLGTLDQGFWPDGIYTAPTDAALKSDLQAHKTLGFNMVRKHIKVEPQRWYYWADKLGLLVWQDMPALDSNLIPDDSAQNEFRHEWRTIVSQHLSSPAIVTWVNQNEGWGQFDQAGLANAVKKWDPSRLVDNMSGINCCGSRDGGNGDLADWHVYVGPSSPTPSRSRAAVLGEFGGLGLKVAGHQWAPERSFSYEMQPDAAALNTRYLGLIAALKPMIANAGLSAAVYTEITDVEGEVNGLLTYDRRVLKVDAARLRAAQRALIAASDAPSTRVPVLNGRLSLQAPGTGKVAVGPEASDPDSLVTLQAVGAGSPDALRARATLRAVPGLADPTCTSFQLAGAPDQYLRHRDFLLRLEPGDTASPAFRQDATFCAERGAAGQGVTLVSYNFRALAVRRSGDRLLMAERGGPHPWDAGTTFDADVTWTLASPPAQ